MKVQAALWARVNKVKTQTGSMNKIKILIKRIFISMSRCFTTVSHTFKTDGARQMIRNVSYNIFPNINTFSSYSIYSIQTQALHQ